MKCRVIMLEGSYIMDSMVFQAYFNIYYGIIVGTTWYRGGFIAERKAYTICIAAEGQEGI